MTVTDVFLYINVLVRLLIGIRLTQFARKNKMRNLLWLAVVFYINAVFNFFTASYLSVPILFRFGICLGQVFLVLFVTGTFYQSGKSPVKFFMGATVLCSVVGLIFTWLALSGFNPALYDLIGVTVIGIAALGNWGWHAVIATRAYAAISSDTYVEDWVKSRYVTMIAYCAVVAISFPSVVLASVAGPLWLIPAALAAIAGSALQFLVWIMPESFRRFLNRNYQQPFVAKDIAEMPEEEVVRHLKLGMLNLSTLTSRFNSHEIIGAKPSLIDESKEPIRLIIAERKLDQTLRSTNSNPNNERRRIEMVSTSKRLALWPISRWRIGLKLPFAFVGLALVPLILVTIFVNTNSRTALLGQGAIFLQSLGRSTAERLDKELSEQREFIRVIGLFPELLRYVQNPNDLVVRDAAQRVLSAAADKASDYESVGIINSDGKIILSSVPADVGIDVRLLPYFTESFKGEVYVSDPSISVINNEPVIFYSAPIKDDRGKVLAVVRSRVKLDGLWDLIEKDNGVTGAGSYSMLLDEYGIRLGDSSSKGNRTVVQESLLFRAVAPLPALIEKTLINEQRFGKASTSGVQVVPVPEIASRLSSGDINVFTTRSDVNNTLNQAVIIPMFNKPWRYVIVAPNETYTAPADSVTQFARLMAVVLGMIALVMGLFLSRTITRPLTRLSQVADRISLGELDAKIEVNGSDEIGELAESIERMQTSLQAAIERLRARRANT